MTLVKDEDDGYLLSATVLDSWQLEWWIKSMGSGILVFEPVELKEALLGDLKKVLSKYALKQDRMGLR